MRQVKILSSNLDQHPAFFRFVDTVFGGGRTETWTVWRDRGGWTADYEVLALIDDGAIVSTIGRSRMRLVIEGEDRAGYQLGAVATLEPCRGQGLARRLMEWVIGSLDVADQPVILFANNRVHDFYPRFGFQRLPQRRSVAAAALHPSGAQALRCDLSDAADRAVPSRLVWKLAERRVSSGLVVGWSRRRGQLGQDLRASRPRSAIR